MDIDLARTFIEIINAGTLVQAAKRLHVTQATVSARLQALEALLDCPLLVRNKAGVRVTAEGQAFLPMATQLVSTWERATREVARTRHGVGTLSIGGEFTLWSALLLNWIVALRSEQKDVILHTRVDAPTKLLDSVQNGALDLAVLYSPHRRPGTQTTLVLEEELVAVSTNPQHHQLEPDDYVFVEWGPDYASQHNGAFPHLVNPKTHIGLGPLALRYLLRVGGSGYFRTRAVAPYCERGVLHRVPNTPTFSYSLHAIYADTANSQLVTWARECLARVAQQPSDTWA